jgi:hypothetical protein
MIILVGIAVGALALSACSGGEAAASLGDQTQVRYGQGNRSANPGGAPAGGVEAPGGEAADLAFDQTQGGYGSGNRGAGLQEDLGSLSQSPALEADHVANGQGGNGRGGNGRVENGRGGQGNGGQGIGGGAALEPLSEAEAAALLRAIEEEYGAQALYESVLAAFGDVEPFSGIAASEAQHTVALVRQAQKYGLEVPEYTGPAEAPAFATLEEACQAGVAAEIADAALYDELSPAVTHADILRVFENLKNASLNNHLPAFEACK